VSLFYCWQEALAVCEYPRSGNTSSEVILTHAGGKKKRGFVFGGVKSRRRVWRLV